MPKSLGKGAKLSCQLEEGDTRSADLVGATETGGVNTDLPCFRGEFNPGDRERRATPEGKSVHEGRARDGEGAIVAELCCGQVEEICEAGPVTRSGEGLQASWKQCRKRTWYTAG